MKLIITLLIVTSLAACKKTTDTNNNISPIFGKWKWYKSYLALTNTTTTPQSTGHTWLLQLNIDFTCSQSGNYFPIQNGFFTLTAEPNPPYTGLFNYLNMTYPSSTLKWDYYFFSSTDSLQLNDNIGLDGPFHYFVRVR